MLRRYWIEQVGASDDLEGTKPILVVGTHADMLSKQDRDRWTNQMELLYPAPAPRTRNRNQVHGHFEISLVNERLGLADLRSKLIDIGLFHPKIGVGQVKVPRGFVMMQREIDIVKEGKPYLWWREYAELATLIGIFISSKQSLLLD